MGSIGRVISTTIDNFVFGVIQRKLGQKLEMSYFSAAGDDSPVLPNDKVYFASKDGKGQFAVLGSLMISQGAAAGEKILYSRDSEGVVKGKVYIKADGSIVLNDGTDFAVAFEDLKAGFDAFVSTFNAHIHTSGGSGSPTTTPTVPSTDNIDGSKVDTVRMP